MKQPYPILEFDPGREALIEPHHFSKAMEIPEHCVLCFFHEVIAKLAQSGRAEKIAKQFSTLGAHPVFRADLDGRPFVLAHPGLGAPFAAAMLEELIARGCKKFVACGGAGVLDSSIAVGELIVPTEAVRDEGTSYHYLPAGREVSATPEAVAAIERTLQNHHIPFRRGKTWTTDAVFRETPQRVAMRKAEGCCVVEMEAAAFFAVAQFRGVSFGQLLYGGDDLGGEVWQHRNWTHDAPTREKLFWLAAEACLAI